MPTGFLIERAPEESLAVAELRRGPPELFFALHQARVRALELEGLHPQPEVAQHQAREGGEPAPLRGSERARDPVEDAECPEDVPVRVDERRAGVEAHVRRAGDERVVVEALVGDGVGDHEDVRLEDRVRAEGDVARGLGRVEPHARLEPLAPLVHEADERDRRLADRRGEGDEVVELRLGERVEEVERAQRGEALRFVRGERRDLHGSASTIRRISAGRDMGSNGLLTTPAAPSARRRAISSRCTFAVTSRIGTAERSAFSRRRAYVSGPSIDGIMTSSKMTSGW